jgi:hypothetical protein
MTNPDNRHKVCLFLKEFKMVSYALANRPEAVAGRHQCCCSGYGQAPNALLNDSGAPRIQSNLAGSVASRPSDPTMILSTFSWASRSFFSQCRLRAAPRS